MYNLNDIFYIDEEYSARAKFCNENNYRIEEIEPDEKGRRFQIVDPSQDIRIQICNRISELEQWFEFYDGQIKQAERCERLGIVYDNKYGSIKELDDQATKNAVELKDLREKLRGFTENTSQV